MTQGNMVFRYRGTAFVLLCAALLAIQIPEVFSGSSARVDPEADQQISYRVVSEAELDEARGGFMLSNGLIVNISIEKRVYQNGVETFASFFESPDNMSMLSITEAAAAAGLIDASDLHSVTQNNLDDQLIQTLNTVNVEVSNTRAIEGTATQSDTFRTLLAPTFQ